MPIQYTQLPRNINDIEMLVRRFSPIRLCASWSPLDHHNKMHLYITVTKCAVFEFILTLSW